MHEEIKSVLQRTINLLEASSRWDDRASVEAHAVGLEGEASRTRYLSRKAHMLVQHYQHCAEDLFSDLTTTTKIFPIINATEFPSISSREVYMTTVLAKMWSVYFDLHKLANEMSSVLYQPLATHLFCFLDEQLCIIGELHKAEREYMWAKWEYHHISRYQLSWCNVEDKYGKLEKSQGY